MDVITDVCLTWPELRWAAHVGMDRFVRALASDRTPTYGVDVNDWKALVLGAWGECVIAKTTGYYWAGDLGKPDQGAPDVGPWHVRTRSRRDWDLTLHPRDHDDEPYVLVVQHQLPRFRIVGWCYGHEGKIDAYWSDPAGKNRWAYFVPQDALRPFDGSH